MKGLFVGQTAVKRRRFTAAEVAAYQQLTGDSGLGYARPASSKNTVPGPMLGGLISDLLGTELPGRGTNWLKQRFLFVQPALIDEELKAAVKITKVRPEKELINLAVKISGPSGKTICKGEALVLVKDLGMA